MWRYNVTAFFRFISAILLTALITMPLFLVNTTAFPTENQKEYYVYTPSSNAEIYESLTIFQLPYLQGECARVQTKNGETFAQKIFEKYSATLLQKEVFDDGVSYYCYSPKLKGGVRIESGVVNLHVIIKEKEVVLGTPIVFGGY